jgi:hypothetical protein
MVRIAYTDWSKKMMTPREIDKLVEGYIGTNGGYLNQFSYSKHDHFYPHYCDLDIDTAAYRSKGYTTRTAFIQILKDSKPREQAKIIRGVFAMIPPPDEASDSESRRKIALYKELLAGATRLEADGQVDAPEIQNTSAVVLEALRDAEALLKARGPQSAVDRAHTALHGYLKKICIDRGKPMPADASLTALFKVLREQFPEFSIVIPHDAEARKIFGSIATALDSLNTIRNRGTLAHPNDLLLEASEAMLFINLSRAVLAYIDSKVTRNQF